MNTRRRCIVVTGASRGIGAAIRDRLLAEGHRVIGLGRTVQPLPAAPEYFPVVVDLANVEQIDALLGDVARTHNDIDTLVANAGAPTFGHLEQHNVAAIRAAIDINLVSHMVVTRSLLPALKRNAPGDVLFIGSESALAGAKRGTLYCAAKFGIRGFAQALRAECAPAGVRVTQIHPGMVRTSFFDTQDFRPGDAPQNAIEPADVAEAVSGVLGLRSHTVVDEIVLSPMTKVVQRTGR